MSSGEVIGIRTIKNGPFHDYVKLAGPEEAEAIEKGCTLHTLFGGTDADGGHWTCHSRLGIAWPAQYAKYFAATPKGEPTGEDIYEVFKNAAATPNPETGEPKQ